MAKNRSVDIPNTTPTYKTWESSNGANWTVERNWTWHEVYEWVLNVGEIFSVKPSYKKDPTKELSDAFVVTDSDKKVYEILLHKPEHLAFTEELKPSLSFLRWFDESITLIETPSKHPELPFNDSFAMFDTLARSAQGVLSDILFESGSWTVESMQEAMLRGKHVGYENFKPFVYGDYTYDKALFRVALDATSEDRAVLEQFQITVDVPDMVDRGSAEISDKNYDETIEFNKNFHVAPEVTVTIRAGVSGTPLTPEITETTEDHFKVHLINTLTGERSLGRFTWTAVGY